jgi:rhodanese-related sulfurtransferase
MRRAHLLLGWLPMFIAGAALAGETASIDAAALLKRIQAKDPALVVLDVRTPQEFAAGHVPGAINIPSTHFPARSAELPSDKDVVIYCAVGVRAEHAATSLRENGFTRLLHLQGDMTGWADSKRPVEK